MHPGGVDALAFGPNMDAWSKKFRVYTSERRGHGHTTDVKGPLTFADMANDTVAFIENIVGAPTMFAELGKHPGDTVTVHLTERHPPK